MNACGGTPNCSGSTTVGVWLANGGRFGLTLCDNGLGCQLTFRVLRNFGDLGRRGSASAL
jgi:hypothetical protein